MCNEIESKVKKVMFETLDLNCDINTINVETPLETLDINSISFIKMLVAFESEFNIEFDDEELNIDQFNTFQDIVNSIAKKL